MLHIGARLATDLAPAKKLGMRTALFAGDKESLQATSEQLKAATGIDLGAVARRIAAPAPPQGQPKP